eukprot:747379-Hanusia_phi.AAC.1
MMMMMMMMMRRRRRRRGRRRRREAGGGGGRQEEDAQDCFCSPRVLCVMIFLVNARGSSALKTPRPEMEEEATASDGTCTSPGKEEAQG